MAEEKPDYRKLKLRAGIEIHQQLDSKHKLFCPCSTQMQEKEPFMTVARKQHPVASELGHVDTAAQFESLRNRTFLYQVFRNESCLVDLDEEPPHQLDKEALQTAIEIALLFNCYIPSEINVMRKTITDGSNTGAFQRTMIIGRDGWMKYGSRKVEIRQIALEEDAAAIVGEEKEAEAEASTDGLVMQKEKRVTYRLNRLGIPLVEITTGLLEDYTPEQVQEIAFMIGITCRSTEKVKRGIGTIRQDLNVSVKGGDRVEVKGVQELGQLAKVVEKEADRQLQLIRDGKKIVQETRAANIDGSTRFMRPMPGAARMYPETDVPPVVLDEKWVASLKEKLPEPWTDKLERFVKKMELPKDIALQMISSDYMSLFEKAIAKHPKISATIVANVFTSTLKDITRKKADVKKIEERHLMSIFSELDKKRIVKEAIPDLLLNFSTNPDEPIADALKKLNLTMLSDAELKAIVEQLVKDSPGTAKERLYGITMGRVRGRADPQEVLKAVEKAMKK
jgi:Glu-tRNA(Gln) amidotransferase subunit E-like FAD-binding protein